MSSRPWMPIYWGDYIADTTHLTMAQHGAYLLLIAHHWQHGSLPNDERQLKRITKCPNNYWKITWAALQPFFSVEVNKSGSLELKQKRVNTELAKADEIMTKRQIYGAKGGLANRGKTNRERNYDKQLLKQRDDQSQSHKITTTEYVAEGTSEKGKDKRFAHSKSLEEIVRQKGWVG